VWRSRVIRFLPDPSIRPSPDRVRETLFNWLGQELHGLRCLDLFAGSGVLGFEAASRGASEVILVDRDARTVMGLRQTANLLDACQIRVIKDDALKFLREDRGRFDVVFLDPPFVQGITRELMSAVAPRLADGGRVYTESGGELPAYEGWRVLRQRRAGAVNFQLLELEQQ
jgi:16S rRNA (guanine966-N2)-methyltransferase